MGKFPRSKVVLKKNKQKYKENLSARWGTGGEGRGILVDNGKGVNRPFNFEYSLPQFESKSVQNVAFLKFMVNTTKVY